MSTTFHKIILIFLFWPSLLFWVGACSSPQKKIDIPDTTSSDSKLEPEPEPEPPRLTSISVTPSVLFLVRGESIPIRVYGTDQYNKPYPLSPDKADEQLFFTSTLGTLDKEGIFTSGKKSEAEVVDVKVGEITTELPITVCKSLKVKVYEGNHHDVIEWTATKPNELVIAKEEMTILKLPVILKCRGVAIPILAIQDIVLTVGEDEFYPIGISQSPPEIGEMDFFVERMKIGTLELHVGEVLLRLVAGKEDGLIEFWWGMDRQPLSLIFRIPKEASKGSLRIGTSKRSKVKWN